MGKNTVRSGSLKKSIILMDVENIWFGILRAPDFEGVRKKNVLLRAAVVALERAVRSLENEVAERWGAIAIPPLFRSGPDGVSATTNSGRREQVKRAVETLADWGYNIVTVKEGGDAADNALCRVGEAFLANDEIKTVVLGTGDGKEPFATLVSRFVEAGKKVHCISYCRTPLVIKRRGDVTYSLLVEEVRKILGASINAPTT